MVFYGLVDSRRRQSDRWAKRIKRRSAEMREKETYDVEKRQSAEFRERERLRLRL